MIPHRQGQPIRMPRGLLEEVSSSLHPVRPGPLPIHLALAILPLAGLITLLLLATLGLRKDARVLGSLVTFGPSLVEAALAVTIIWLAARESTPSQRFPRWRLWFAITACSLAVILLTVWTFLNSPALIISTQTARLAGLLCGAGAFLAGASLVACLAPFIRRSFAARPALSGALYGAGCGVAVNAGWRLACRVSEPWHSLGVHGGAIVATAILGAIIARRSVKTPSSR